MRIEQPPIMLFYDNSGAVVQSKEPTIGEGNTSSTNIISSER
jgi:hypothetical protein